MDEILYKCIHEGYKMCKRWITPIATITLIQSIEGKYEVWELTINCGTGDVYLKYGEEQSKEFINSYLRDHSQPYKRSS